jgi:hypothetical protein
MCHLCKTIDLDDAKVMMEIHGYQFLQPNAPLEYAVSWDNRIISVTQHKDRAIQQTEEQKRNGVGNWETKQRSCGPWVPLEGAKDDG